MYFFRKLLPAVALAVCLGPLTLADDCNTTCTSGSGPVRLFRSISEGTPTIVRCEQANTDFSFDISGWSGDNILFISHCGSPLGNIGRVTITGELASEASLFVAVVGASEDPTSLSSSGEDLDPACVNFGGLLITDSATRGKTRASISVTGAIEHRGSDPAAPDVEVNQIVRVQSDNEINGNIHAVATGPFVGSFIDAVGQIRAGKSVAGNIIAVGGDIFAVRVLDPGTPASGEAITGDIICQRGTIRTIFSTRPIGTPTDQVKIWAADGIDQVRIVDESALTVPLDRNLYVDVRSGTSPSLNESPLGPEQDGSLRLLETGGDLNGIVRATNLATSYMQNAHFGTLVRGDINAPITVDYMQNYADIVGRSITQPIIIGRQLKGSIVAYGRPDPQNPNDPAGTIASIRIGLDAPPGPDVFGTGAPAEPYANANANANFQRGCIGVSGGARAPHNIDPADYPYTIAPNNPWFYPGSGDGGTLDSVIRAEVRIESLETASMSLNHTTGGKCSRPRIEAPEIGTLRVHGAMETGVVWSGQLDFVNGEVADDIENNYASIGALRIGCVAPQSDLWFQNCSLATIDANLGGEMHLRKLSTLEKIVIGGRLGTMGDICDPIGLSWCASDEQSPRGRRTFAGETVSAERAGIFMLDQQSLAGQIVINANNTLTTGGWEGRVVVGADQLPPPVTAISLDPHAAPDSLDIAPHYERFSDDLGGGAVDLAPFHLYQTDCFPPHDGAGVDDGLSEVLFHSGVRVAARFYGPSKRNNPSLTWAQHVTIKARLFPSPDPNAPWSVSPCSWTDVTSAFDVFGPSETETDSILRRAITLLPKVGFRVAPGIYMLHPKAGNSIRSSDVAGNP